MARVIDQVLGATTSSVVGEITRELVNASDGAGLHFNGSGNISFTPVDLGSKFSHEFVIKADEDLTTGSSSYIIDYEGGSGRFVIGAEPTQASGNLAIYDDAGWKSFGVNPLTDLKVHHIVVTVDGTAAVLYDNGNQVGTATINANHGIDNATAAAIGSNFFTATSNNFEGTIYRARSYNKALSSAEVQTAYERADVDFADQYGEQNLVDADASVFTSGTYSWVAYGSNTIANVSNDLTITYGGNSSGAYNYLRDSFDLKQDLVIGENYRLRMRAKYAGGASGVTIQVYDGSSIIVADSALTTSFVDYEIEFTAQSITDRPFVFFTDLKSGNVVTIDSWQVDQVGCISDYDLAFANPTQSRMVADRSNAADGTASTSGVTQVQPVVQLNSTSARIGTTAATPADGDIVADKVGVGVAPSAPLHAKVAATTASSPLEVARLEVEDNGSGVNMNAGIGPKLSFYAPRNTASVEGASIAAKKESATDETESTTLAFSTCQLGDTSPTERLTIDSTGNILANAPVMDATVGAKKMQLEGSASTAVGPEMLLHNPAQGGGAASLLTFGGKASGTEGYTAAIKATNTGTLSFGTSSASGGFSEPAADLTINNTGQVTVNELAGNTTNSTKLEVRSDADGSTSAIRTTNKDTTAGTNQAAGVDFGLSRNSGAFKPQAGQIKVGREADWDASDTNIDSYMAFSTYANNALGEAVRITSDGSVGIGTPTPTVGNLQIRDDSVSILALTRTTASTSSDIGMVRFGNTNVDSNLANIVAYHDGANDSARLVFQTQATGGATADRLTIASSGLAEFSGGIAQGGTSGDNTAYIDTSGQLYISRPSGTGRNHIIIINDGSTVGSITSNASATQYNTSSDYRLKENLEPLTGALDRIDQLPVYRFNFKADPDTTVDGFVAHEVSAHVPEAVTGEKDAMKTVVVQEAVEAVEAVAATYWEEGDELPEGVAVGDEKTAAVEAVEAVEEVTEEQPDFQGIDQSKLVPLLVAAVKELKAKVETLENA